MITYAEALAAIAAMRFPSGVSELPLEECVGATLARDISALVPSPPYTNSAMDGFAVRRKDLLTHSSLEIIETIFARPVDPKSLRVAAPGECVRIMTGGYLPEWADTVIPVEDSEQDGERRVKFKRIPEVGENVRREGEDLARGSLILKAGALIDAERLMVAAAVGHRQLAVEPKPRIVFLSTGDELEEPGEPLLPGAIYNSSKYFLLAAAQQLSLASTHKTLPDDPSAAEGAIRAIMAEKRPVIVVSTGAVSAGEADFIPRLGERLGFKALFHRVAIRPGKPVYLAQKDHVIWLGLPGNAISTCVGWHFFARPLLTAVARMAPAPTRRVRLANDVGKPPQLRCFFRAEVGGPNGSKAWVTKRQGSAQLGASITNDAYVVLPEGASRLSADTEVEALLV